jgi:hypothetical protein
MEAEEVAAWSPQAQLSLKRFPSLVPLQAAYLPVREASAHYSVELALAQCQFFDFDEFGIKGPSHRRPNIEWEKVFRPWCFAMCFANNEFHVENSSFIGDENRNHLGSVLKACHSGLEKLINEPVRATSTGAQLLDEIVGQFGYRYKNNGSIFKIEFQLMANIVGVAAATKRLQDFYPQIPSDYLEPLRAQNSDPIGVIRRPTIPSSTERASAKIASGNRGIHSYAKWVRYCREVAELQQIGINIYSDLIPTSAVADHSLVDLSTFEREIEEVLPGRKSWLLTEGVKPEEFAFFWSMPTWSQNFVYELMRWNFRLEFELHQKNGLNDEAALKASIGFIPTYSVEPPSDEDLDDPLRPLPFELFERVRHHMADLDSEEYQAELIRNECFVANDYVRRQIRHGKL